MIPRHRFPRLHFVGVGGAGMAPLAAWHKAQGFAVSGSDAANSENFAWLRSLGVEVTLGHNRLALGNATLVVRSSAVPETNPEVAEARRMGIPVVRRAECLGEVTRSLHTIAVSGTHGKTTTTLMVAQIFGSSGLGASVIAGGRTKEDMAPVAVGAEPNLVIEADEYDRTMLALHPDAVLVTNLEAEHLDCYRDLEDLRSSFVSWLARLPFHGYVVLCADDPGASSLREGALVRVLTYGFGPEADYRGRELPDGTVEVTRCGRILTSFRLAVPGRHNRLNALGALSLCHLEGVDPELASLALARFTGALRRLQRLGEYKGMEIWDDYAHHPTEIAASLSALREHRPDRPMAVVFQPHLYSRTRDHAQNFARVLHEAGCPVFVTPVYPSRETPDMGAGSEAIAAHLPQTTAVRLVEGREEALAELAATSRAGGLAIFMGAGSVSSWAHSLIGEVSRA